MLELILAATKIEDEGDREFLSRLFTKYEKPLKVCAMGILENESDAEDCLIETFVKITDYIEKYKNASEDYRKNLLFLSCKNIARTMRRDNNQKRNNETSLDSYDSESGEITEKELADMNFNIERLAITDYTQSVVRENLNKLKQRHKEVLVLKYYHNMSNQEIARYLGVGEAVVSMRIIRAKAELLEKGGDTLYDLAER